jgi:predicted dehydrogenase
VTKVAVAGTGFSAAAHVEALRRLPGVEVAALVGRTHERADAAARRLGVPRAVASVAELLRDDEIRAVHNCTPNDVHAEIGAELLDAGRHVLAEKPLALDGSEGRDLAARARAAGVVAGVCFNYRHFPVVQDARARIRSGETGPLHLVHGGYVQDWLLYETDWSWRLDSARNGRSRAVADIGSHWMDLAQHLSGDRIVEVCADLHRLHGERERPTGPTESFAASQGATERVAIDTEDAGSVLVRFAGGARGSFLVSQVSAGRKNHLTIELDGADEALAWDQEDPGRLWIGHRARPNELLTRDPGLLHAEAAPLARLPGGHEEGWADGLRNLVADFHAQVAAHERREEREHVFASFDEGAYVCALVDAILESHATRGWVAVTVPEGASA